jgi:hypothetical protein
MQKVLLTHETEVSWFAPSVGGPTLGVGWVVHPEPFHDAARVDAGCDPSPSGKLDHPTASQKVAVAHETPVYAELLASSSAPTWPLHIADGPGDQRLPFHISVKGISGPEIEFISPTAIHEFKDPHEMPAPTLVVSSCFGVLCIAHMVPGVALTPVLTIAAASPARVTSRTADDRRKAEKASRRATRPP